jgi:hypothetical protein
MLGRQEPGFASAGSWLRAGALVSVCAWRIPGKALAILASSMSNRLNRLNSVSSSQILDRDAWHLISLSGYLGCLGQSRYSLDLRLTQGV